MAGRKIGILGGSFNPAHEGHLEMSLYALKRLGLDQIWWLVTPQNPLKNPKDIAAFDQRMARARRTARHPHLIVTGIEAELGTRYTADTLRLLMRRFPRTRFVWLMGTENLQQVWRWKDWEDIFARVPVAIFRRPCYPAGRGMGRAPIRFGRFWRPPETGLTLARATPPVWLELDNRLNYTSATHIRQKDPSWLLPRKKPLRKKRL